MWAYYELDISTMNMETRGPVSYNVIPCPYVRFLYFVYVVSIVCELECFWSIHYSWAKTLKLVSFLPTYLVALWISQQIPLLKLGRSSKGLQ